MTTACTATRHGTESAYTSAGCRCPQAREAWRLYNKRRREGRHPPRLVDSTGAARRMQALVADGWSWRELARRSGRSTRTITDVGSHRRPVVQESTAAWVRDLYTKLAGLDGGSAYARTVAARHGWAPPEAWHGNSIDDPKATPAMPSTTSSRPLVDRVAVDRVLAGRWAALTTEERHYAVHEGLGQGMSLTRVARLLRVAHRRVVTLSHLPLPDVEVAA